MLRHDSTTHEAARLARRAVAIRAKARHEAESLRAWGFEADARAAEKAGELAAVAAEERALALSGYTAPVASLPWSPSIHDRLPVGRKLAGVCLGLALALGVTARAEACDERTYDAAFERAIVRDDGSDPASEARAACEAADMPGTLEWARERAEGCPNLGTSWVMPDPNGFWSAVCGTPDGQPWLIVDAGDEAEALDPLADYLEALP